MAERDDSPKALAHALVQRIFELLHELRTTLPKLELPREMSESASAHAERLLYLALLGAIEAGLVRTMEGRGHRLEAGQRAPRADGGGVAPGAGEAACRPREAGGGPVKLVFVSGLRWRISRRRLRRWSMPRYWGILFLAVKPAQARARKALSCTGWPSSCGSVTPST
jgi:hypothetical protein